MEVFLGIVNVVGLVILSALAFVVFVLLLSFLGLVNTYLRVKIKLSEWEAQAKGIELRRPRSKK